MISRRRFLGGAVVTAAGVGGFVGLKAVQSQPAWAEGVLTPREAHAAVIAGEILLIDIRRPDEWRETGIAEGATAIDMRRADFIDALRAARSDPSLPIALICARGVRSKRMFDALQAEGLRLVLDVPEGMLGSRAGPGWIARGLPVVDWVDPA